MNVAAWLRGLGLDQYGEAFARNGVDGEVLPLLRAEDLRELGVAAVGHRRKLLDALTRLRSTRRGAGAAPAVTKLEDGRAAPVGERRQLTVMFVDLIGFTELSVRLDPEELREVLRTYQPPWRPRSRASAAWSRVSSATACWPISASRRPTRTMPNGPCAPGSRIVEAARRCGPRTAGRCASRVGIATGLVVVGDLIGSGPAREQAAVGETPNLAARLQALAEPGTVVIADRTRQLIGGLFDCVDLGCRPVSGFPGAAPGLAGDRPEPNRGSVRGTSGRRPMPLVGRDAATRLPARPLAAGQGAPARWSCWPESPASASRASCRRWSIGCRGSRMCGSTAGARRFMRAARSIR